MNKKALVMLAASATVFLASVYSYVLAASYEPTGIAPEKQVSDSVTVASQSDQTFQTKVIRLWHDKAAVFVPGEENPEVILPADTSALPDDVLFRLKQGIYVYTIDQYINYIEDFS